MRINNKWTVTNDALKEKWINKNQRNWSLRGCIFRQKKYSNTKSYDANKAWNDKYEDLKYEDLKYQKTRRKVRMWLATKDKKANNNPATLDVKN